MNADLYKQSLRHLIYQRNSLLFFSCALSVSVILLGVLLFWKTERIVVVPPYIQNEFWVEQKVFRPPI